MSTNYSSELTKRSVELYRQRLSDIISEKPVDEASFGAIFDLIKTCGDGCSIPGTPTDASYILMSI